MKKLLLAVFLVGCGTEATTTDSNWVVALNGGVAPSCVGTMRTSITQSPGAADTVIGNWSCIESAEDCAVMRAGQPTWECFSLGGGVTGLRSKWGHLPLTLDTFGGATAQYAAVTNGSMVAGRIPLFDGEQSLIATR